MESVTIFTFDVPEEKQAEYLKATAEKIKPFWESHGCQAYDIWQSTEGSPAFLKTMFYADTGAGPGGPEMSDEAKAIVGLFMSFATNISPKTYVKKT